MDARSYDEFCALAVALDHLGERWTLLVIRELMTGPKRYSDLRDGLPGIAANLLAARLRRLEADGLVHRRRLPRPAPSTVYELTDSGRDLEPALLALMRWGSRWMTRPGDGTAVRASWLGLALKALALPEQLRADADIELVGPEETVRLRVADGRLDVTSGPVPEPTARLTADPGVMFRIASGGTSLEAEVLGGRATVDGSAASVRVLAEVLRLPRG